MLIWTNFDSFVITYLIQVDSFHNFISQAQLNSLQTQNGLELVSRLQLLQNFLMKLYLSEYDINWAHFINRQGLLPKLFSKMYFLLYA